MHQHLYQGLTSFIEDVAISLQKEHNLPKLSSYPLTEVVAVSYFVADKFSCLFYDYNHITKGNSESVLTTSNDDSQEAMTKVERYNQISLRVQNADMNRQSHKQEIFNLGEPLPLTYLPSNQNKFKSKSKSNPNSNRFTSSLHDTAQTPIAPTPYTVSSLPNNADGELYYRNTFKRTPGTRKTSQGRIQDRIRTKLSQLDQELDGLIHEATDIELIDIKLDEILELINDLKSQRDETETQEENVNNAQVDELLKKLENAKLKANLQTTSRLNTVSNRVSNYVYSFRYWITASIVFLILFFTSSVLAADFKYRYCYYFC
ncbi:hypothetical protein KGF57_003942 [Candida theae]|uniref:Uncharacterized protein n=1 Tax=Candida theae TaxID=1198502 RepID=A0AAD5FXJ0_9ASCO|nr:uncharacterized protein KGF57_003942 [Candida theae]KAI5953733.1 hypothetical protein KGF57_003942 [Candida theae]